MIFLSSWHYRHSSRGRQRCSGELALTDVTSLTLGPETSYMPDWRAVDAEDQVCKPGEQGLKPLTPAKILCGRLEV